MASVILAVFARGGFDTPADAAEARDRMVEDAIGERPDPDTRTEMMRQLMFVPVILAFVLGAFGLAVGAAVQAFASDAAGSFVMRSFGVVFTAPLLGLAVCWAVRGFFEAADRRSWDASNLGKDQYEPSAISQPRDQDFLYAIPFAVIFAAFFISV